MDALLKVLAFEGGAWVVVAILVLMVAAQAAYIVQLPPSNQKAASAIDASSRTTEAFAEANKRVVDGLASVVRSVEENTRAQVKAMEVLYGVKGAVAVNTKSIDVLDSTVGMNTLAVSGGWPKRGKAHSLPTEDPT